MDRRVELYEETQKMKSYALKLTKNEQDAEDLVQETGIKAMRNAERFDPTKSKMVTWLSHIMKNLYIDSVRKKKPVIVNDADMGEEGIEDRHEITIPSYNDGSEQIKYDELVKVIKSNITNERDVEILSMIHEGYSQKDVAEKFDINVNSVKQILQRIKKKLKNKVIKLWNKEIRFISNYF